VSWLGKILGGGLGLILGGPLGALLGAAAGHAFIDQGLSGARLSTTERRQTAFFVAVFAMLGKMAKADGRVSPQEIAVVEAFMRDNLRLGSDARKLGISVFNEAKTDETPFVDYARQAGKMFANEPDLCLLLFQVLYALAMADGELHPQEDRLLKEALRPLGLRASVYEDLRGGKRTRRAPGKAVLAEYYEVLGISAEATDTEVKKAYRRAAREFHPDTVIAKGLPEEFVKFAEEKFKQVGAAYEAIMADRAKA
jgi:DnaJ like chaperone protein